MAHVPLRGMVKKQVLEIFSDMYRPGASGIDLSGADAAGEGGVKAYVDRALNWYVARKMRKG